MKICLGDVAQRVINAVTFGTGKTTAEYIANALGFESCGCSERQNKWNELGNCFKPVSLVEETHTKKKKKKYYPRKKSVSKKAE